MSEMLRMLSCFSITHYLVNISVMMLCAYINLSSHVSGVSSKDIGGLLAVSSTN